MNNAPISQQFVVSRPIHLAERLHPKGLLTVIRSMATRRRNQSMEMSLPDTHRIKLPDINAQEGEGFTQTRLQLLFHSIGAFVCGPVPPFGKELFSDLSSATLMLECVEGPQDFRPLRSG